MRINKIIIILILVLIGAQPLFANYAFYRKVTNTCKYYRVEVKKSNMSLTRSADDTYDFSINLKSNRNNFEMVMLVGFISAGQAIKHQREFAKNTPNFTPVVPQFTEVSVTIPTGKVDMIISARANVEVILLFVNGKIDSTEFMHKIKDSIQTL